MASLTGDFSSQARIDLLLSELTLGMYSSNLGQWFRAAWSLMLELSTNLEEQDLNSIMGQLEAMREASNIFESRMQNGKKVSIPPDIARSMTQLDIRLRHAAAKKRETSQ